MRAHTLPATYGPLLALEPGQTATVAEKHSTALYRRLSALKAAGLYFTAKRVPEGFSVTRVLSVVQQLEQMRNLT